MKNLEHINSVIKELTLNELLSVKANLLAEIKLKKSLGRVKKTKIDICEDC